MSQKQVNTIEAMELVLGITPINSKDLVGRLLNIKQAQKKKEDEAKQMEEVQKLINELKPQVLGDEVINLAGDDEVSHYSTSSIKRKLSDDDKRKSSDDDDEESTRPAKKQRTSDGTYIAHCNAYECECRMCGKTVLYKNGDKRNMKAHNCPHDFSFEFEEDDYTTNNRDGDRKRDDLMKSFHMTLIGQTESVKKRRS